MSQHYFSPFKRLFISYGFIFFLGFILGSLICLFNYIHTYLAYLFIIFISIDILRKELSSSTKDIIDSFKKDNIFGKDILYYTYFEFLLILGFIIPLFFMSYNIQIMSSIYIILFLFFSLKKNLSLFKYLK